MDLSTALSQLARDDLSLAQALEAGRVVARELRGLSVLAGGRVWEPRRLRTRAEYLEFALALASEARWRRDRQHGDQARSRAWSPLSRGVSWTPPSSPPLARG